AELAVWRAADGSFAFGLAGSDHALGTASGRLRALADLATTTLPRIQAGLDRLAAAVVTEVNAIHRQGITAAGATGTDFFDPAGVTAGSMAVAAPIRQSLGAIATGRPGAGNTYLPGDGSIALELARLGTAPLASLGGQALGAAYAGLIGELAVVSRDADQRAASQEVLVAAATAQRASVSGVSLDEEMVNLMLHQQAYAAAAKLVTVADEMVQDLLRMV
ncbi:MAG TPA: flagellar basal body rod C-terminal domain-containing protein, partial [Gemmatimonadales bacterium]|nr:flagellar basal body rod C-terminal domain-containing protein [Gemmatimonadales bacterium]